MKHFYTQKIFFVLTRVKIEDAQAVFLVFPNAKRYSMEMDSMKLSTTAHV